MSPISGKHWNWATDCAASCFLIIVTFKKRAPSSDPVVAKLQQDPQMAWSFTGVTAPKRVNQVGMFRQTDEASMNGSGPTRTIQPPVEGLGYFHPFVKSGWEWEAFVWRFASFASSHSCHFRHSAIGQGVQGQREGQTSSVLRVDVPKAKH